MRVSFDSIAIGNEWNRPELAKLWGYKGFQAISKGIVTPAKDNKIILFITRDKQDFMEQYEDSLQGDTLRIEGETSHAADKRIINASHNGDEVHLFYRERHHQPFTYYGPVVLDSYRQYTDRPSKFVFNLASVPTERTKT